MNETSRLPRFQPNKAWGAAAGDEVVVSVHGVFPTAYGYTKGGGDTCE